MILKYLIQLYLFSLISCSTAPSSSIKKPINNETITVHTCIPGNAFSDCTMADDSILISDPNKGLIVD